MSQTTTITAPEVYRKKVRVGVIVAVALAVLTVIEYVIAVSMENPLLLLLPFVVAKGLLIMDYFMHVRQLWNEGGH